MSQNNQFIPSDFALFVSKNYLKSPLYDLGCRDGRDTLYFRTLGIHAIGVDLNPQKDRFVKGKFPYFRTEIECLIPLYDTFPFEQRDFTLLPPKYPLGTVYSRSIDSVNKSEQNQTINWAFANLMKDRYILLESKSDLSEVLIKAGFSVMSRSDSQGEKVWNIGMKI